MDTVKFIYLLGLLLLPPVYADDFYKVTYGGSTTQHLTPLDVADEYDRRIAKHLFLTKGNLGRFIARPSFGSESCISVYDVVSKDLLEKHRHLPLVPDKDKRYMITLTAASESLWYSMPENNRDKKAKEVKVKRIDREISYELAVAIQRAWAKMLHHTRYPVKSTRGLDGITYQFSVWVRGLGVLHGETWAPNGGLTADLASLGNALRGLARDKEAGEQPLIKRLKEFEVKVPEVK